MTPYFETPDRRITIYCGDCREVLPLLADPVDLVLTDPPYSPACHAGARTGVSGDPMKPRAAHHRAVIRSEEDTRLVTFAPIDDGELRDMIGLAGRLSRAWVVSFMDWRHIAALEANPPDGLRFVRFGIWVKPNGAPQFTGDRPGPGWEGIAFLHRDTGRMAWNGRGRSSVFTCNKVDGGHPTQKPLPLVKELVSLFSNPDDIVLDPFGGSGTTARACYDLGRRCVMVEKDEAYCEIAARRLSQQVLPLGEIA